MKFNKNLKRVPELWNCHQLMGISHDLECGPVTLTLSPGSLVICSIHRLTKRKI